MSDVLAERADTLGRSSTETRAAARRGASRGEARDLRRTWLFLLPAGAFYVFVVIVPSARGVIYAFTDWDGLAQTFQFTGLDNFTAMFHDPLARAATVQTLFYAVVVTIFATLFGLLLALALSSRIRSRNVLRVVVFIPSVIMPVVVGFLWKFLYTPTDGPFSALLLHLGVPAASVPDWLGSPGMVRWSVAAVVIWQYSGLSMIIFIAGLTNVPSEVLDAAKVDGATPFQTFRHLTLPLLRPATTVVVALTLASCIKLFDQVWVLTQGGPADSSHTLTTALYQKAFTLGHYGDASVLAIAVTVLAVVTSSFQFRIRREPEGRS